MRESTIEKYLRKEIAKLGGWCEKHASPGTKGPPDNIVMWASGHVLYENDGVTAVWMGASRVEFIENKAPKKGPTVLQARDHARRRAMGFQVHVISTMEMAEAYLYMRGKR